MKDNAFQRRRDIERMLKSGKKLTTSEMMKLYGVGRKAIRRHYRRGTSRYHKTGI